MSDSKLINPIDEQTKSVNDVHRKMLSTPPQNPKPKKKTKKEAK